MDRFSSSKAFVAALALAPSTAFAHGGLGDAQSILHGFAHPFGGLDHVLAMVAVGVVAAQLGGRALWALPASFIAAMALAGACGMAGGVLPFLESGIALSVLALGTIIAFQLRLAVTIAMAMVALFAVFHGYAHGLEVAGARAGFGFVLATACLHLAGIALGLTLGRAEVHSGRRQARAGGGALMMVGMTMLAVAQMS